MTDKNPWSYEDWDPVAQANYIRTKGMARARIRAAEAGNTIHGTRPPAPKIKTKPGQLNKHQQAVHALVHRRNSLRAPSVPVQDLGFVGMDFGFDVSDDLYVDREIDIVLFPGIKTFSARYALGIAEQTALGDTLIINPPVFNIALDTSHPTVTPERRLIANYVVGITDTTLFGAERDLTVSMDLGVSQDVQVNEAHLVANASLGIDESQPDIDVAQSIVASMNVGVAEAASVHRDDFLTLAFDLGIDEAAVAGPERRLTVDMDMGFDCATQTDPFYSLSAALALGVSDATTLIAEVSLVVNALLGFDQNLTLDFERDSTQDFDLGVTMDVQPYLPFNLAPISFSLGVSEAASVTRQIEITAAPSLGISEAAVAEARPPGTLRATFLQENKDTSNSTGTSLASQSFGAADPQRYLVALIGCDSSPSSLSGVTIGGVAATVLIANTMPGTHSCAIAIAAVPTGTSGTIAMTWGTTPGNVSVGLYRVIAPLGVNLTPIDSQRNVGSLGPYARNFTVVNGGLLFQVGASANGAGGQDFTFDAGEDYDNSASGHAHAGSHVSVTADSSTYPQSIAIDNGGTINSAVAASIGPKNEVDIVAAPSLGVSETISAISSSASLIASMAVGASEAVSVSASAPLTNLTFAGSDSAGVVANQNFSFTSKAIGTAAADRWVIVVMNLSNGSNNIASCTIGGVTATKLVENPTTGRRQSVWAANVPTGTTATIAFSQVGSQLSKWSITWYTLNGPMNTTPVATLHNDDTANTLNSQNIAVSAGGVCIMSFTCSSSTVAWAAGSPAMTNSLAIESYGDGGSLRRANRMASYAAAGTQTTGQITNFGTSNGFLAVSLAPV